MTLSAGYRFEANQALRQVQLAVAPGMVDLVTATSPART